MHATKVQEVIPLELSRENHRSLELPTKMSSGRLFEHATAVLQQLHGLRDSEGSLNSGYDDPGSSNKRRHWQQQPAKGEKEEIAAAHGD